MILRPPNKSCQDKTGPGKKAPQPTDCARAAIASGLRQGAGKLLQGGEALGQRAVAELGVELGIGGLHVGLDEEQAYAAEQLALQYPAHEGELLDEDLPQQAIVTALRKYSK